MLEKLRKRKDEKHKPEKLSNRETTKLMDKRAKLTLIMCNLRSKTGDFTKFIRKSFVISKNIHTFAVTVPTTLSKLAQRTRVGLLLFTIITIIHILFYKDTPIPLFPTFSTG